MIRSPILMQCVVAVAWTTLTVVSTSTSTATSIASINDVLWEDDFTTLDTKTWNVGDDATQCLSASGIQTFTPTNVNIDSNEFCTITTSKSDDNTFASGQIDTYNKVQFQYCTVSARVKIPDSQVGIVPTFYTQGVQYTDTDTKWPSNGEINIMKVGQANASNERTTSGIHYVSNTGNYVSNTGSRDCGVDLSGDYFAYTVDWTPTKITTYINDDVVWSIDIDDCGASGTCDEFHQPHYLIFHTTVGGSFPSPNCQLSASASASGGTIPNTCVESDQLNEVGEITAPVPASMSIDWVRIYENGHCQLNVIDNDGTKSVQGTSGGSSPVASPIGSDSGTGGGSAPTGSDSGTGGGSPPTGSGSGTGGGTPPTGTDSGTGGGSPPTGSGSGTGGAPTPVGTDSGTGGGSPPTGSGSGTGGDDDYYPPAPIGPDAPDSGGGVTEPAPVPVPVPVPVPEPVPVPVPIVSVPLDVPPVHPPVNPPVVQPPVSVVAPSLPVSPPSNVVQPAYEPPTTSVGGDDNGKGKGSSGGKGDSSPGVVGDGNGKGKGSSGKGDSSSVSGDNTGSPKTYKKKCKDKKTGKTITVDAEVGSGKGGKGGKGDSDSGVVGGDNSCDGKGCSGGKGSSGSDSGVVGDGNGGKGGKGNPSSPGVIGDGVGTMAPATAPSITPPASAPVSPPVSVPVSPPVPIPVDSSVDAPVDYYPPASSPVSPPTLGGVGEPPVSPPTAGGVGEPPVTPPVPVPVPEPVPVPIPVPVPVPLPVPEPVPVPLPVPVPIPVPVPVPLPVPEPIPVPVPVVIPVSPPVSAEVPPMTSPAVAPFAPPTTGGVTAPSKPPYGDAAPTDEEYRRHHQRRAGRRLQHNRQKHRFTSTGNSDAAGVVEDEEEVEECTDAEVASLAINSAAGIDFKNDVLRTNWFMVVTTSIVGVFVMCFF